jgi:hypothetical protein
MIVSLAHEVDMTRIYVQLNGKENAIGIKAEKVERDAVKNKLVVKDSQGQIIGEFDLMSVAGWWIGE